MLPIERMDIDEAITLPDSIRNENFGIAEEKAVKAIQKHSMLIKGKEHNPQIDEAYLLLGKARYFDQRFIPALEAFNYILHKYPASNNINHAQVWREKTNMRIGNDKLAIKNLKRILELEELDHQDLADANATLAQAYLNVQYADSAIAPLAKAAEVTKNNEEKGRYYFILGQVHNSLNQVSQANAAFDEVIALNRRSPRVYMINAHIGKAQNFNYGEGKNYRLLEVLNDLAEDRENRPFLDKIYFQLGRYYHKQDSLAVAKDFYNKSLASPESDKYLKSINYEILADMNFDAANYREASKYYDSTLIEMSPRLREYRQIKKRRDNLEDVIAYEEVAEETDSIIRLASLSEEKQLEFFTAYTETLKAIATAESLSADGGINFQQNTGGAATSATPGGAGSFYFYNKVRAEDGAREFRQKWGNLQLGDNWRWGEQRFTETDAEEEKGVIAINFEEDPRFDPMTYINQIPDNPELLDSLAGERNYAWFQLGVIYKEKYGEYGMAANRLEQLLESGPEDRLIVPTKFNLYEIYGALGENARAETIKQDILNNYPDSRYAAYIQNPRSVTEEDTSPEARYAEVYRKFENGKYDEVLAESETYIREMAGEAVLPKFELLKAMATGRLLGINAYKSALNHVVLTYPQTEEGKKAKEIYEKTLPELERKRDFNRDTSVTGFKLLYGFKSANRDSAEDLKKKIQGAIEELEYSFTTSIDVYNPSTLLVVVHGLENRQRTLGFAELLQNEDYEIEHEFIEISTENYSIVQIHKNLDNYQPPEN